MYETTNIAAVIGEPFRGSDAHVIPQPKGHILLVDDELVMVRAYSRALAAEGYDVSTATDGIVAEKLTATHSFDVVISDIVMPGMTGLELLRAVRRHDLDVPVILMTGDPTDDVGKQAVELGALMLLVKPVDFRALLQLVDHAVQLRKLARIKREVFEHLGVSGDRAADRAGLEVRFEAALPALWVAFQPIVRAESGEIVGYEALARSDDDVLRDPGAIFAAAERLGRVRELGRVLRRRVAAAIAEAPAGALIFVNLHVEELGDPELGAADDVLRRHASRIVLEVTERDSLESIENLPARLVELRAAGFRIAVDDLGAGYAGLSSFAVLKPEVVKIDLSLVRGLDRDPMKRKLVRSIASLCRELEVELVAEGVETIEESHALGALGCGLQQGFLFARPQRGFVKHIPRVR